MSFVTAVPEFVETAAEQLAGIRSALVEASSTALGATTEVAPAAADEVSEAIARLFGTLGEDFQAVSAQATSYHEEFVTLLGQGATAYAAAEAVNGSALLSLDRLGAAIQLSSNNVATQVNGALGATFGFGGAGGQVGGSGFGSIGGSFNATTVLRAFGSLPNLGAGLAMQTGGAVTSGLGAGLVQTGQAIMNAGYALEGAGAAMSASGAAMTGQANAAISAFLNGSLRANFSGALNGSFNGTLPSLTEFGQTGGRLIGSLTAHLSHLAGNFSATLPALGANFSAALSGALHGGLPALSGSFTGGLNAMINAGQTLAAHLQFPPLAFPPLTFPGLPTFPSLPPFSVPVLPNLGGAFTGGLNTLVNLGQNLSGNLQFPPLSFPSLPPLTFPSVPTFPALPPLNFTVPALPNLGGALNAALSGNIGLSINGLNAALSGTLPAFPPLTFPALPPFSVPTLPALPPFTVPTLPNLGGAFTGGLNTLINLGQNLSGNLQFPPRTSPPRRHSASRPCRRSPSRRCPTSAAPSPAASTP